MAVDYSKILGSKYNQAMGDAPSVTPVQTDAERTSAAQAAFQGLYNAQTNGLDTSYNESEGSKQAQLQALEAMYSKDAQNALDTGNSGISQLASMYKKRGLSGDYLSDQKSAMGKNTTARIAAVAANRELTTGAANRELDVLAQNYARQKAQVEGSKAASEQNIAYQMRNQQEADNMSTTQAFGNYVLDLLQFRKSGSSGGGGGSSSRGGGSYSPYRKSSTATGGTTSTSTTTQKNSSLYSSPYKTSSMATAADSSGMAQALNKNNPQVTNGKKTLQKVSTRVTTSSKNSKNNRFVSSKK